MGWARPGEGRDEVSLASWSRYLIVSRDHDIGVSGTCMYGNTTTVILLITT